MNPLRAVGATFLRFWRAGALLTLAMLLAAASGHAASAVRGSAQKPNIVVVLVDDFGYECVGANGGTSYRTPVMDKLAATGVRFDACYVQALCTPTRVQLMTGIYNVRNYLNFGRMDPKCVTFANLLKPAGYATCMAGKWQLGMDPELPKKFGFDEYALWQHIRATDGERRPPGRYHNPGLEINGVAKDYTHGEYGPDLISDYALDFITRKKDQPFFLYYTMMLTHDPYQATPDSKDYGQKQLGGGASRRNNRPDGINQHFSDMVEYTDKLIGKLLATLDAAGVRENTLVVVLGDNGTHPDAISMMGDKTVRGGKGQATDAGMHVPLIVNWPSHGATGKVSHDLIDSTDFLPTICEAAGAPVPAELKIDGRSFLPQVRGERGNPREWYYCWYGPHEYLVAEFAATHDFKLSRTGDFFDLRNDIAEKHPLKVADLTGPAADSAKRLQAVLDQYKDARPPALVKPFAPAKKRAAADAAE